MFLARILDQHYQFDNQTATKAVGISGNSAID